MINDSLSWTTDEYQVKEMANTFGKKEQDIKEAFSNLIGVPRDYIKIMARIWEVKNLPLIYFESQTKEKIVKLKDGK